MKPGGMKPGEMKLGGLFSSFFKQCIRTEGGFPDLNDFAPGIEPMPEADLALRHTKNTGKKLQQRGVGGAFHRQGGQPDFQRVPM